MEDEFEATLSGTDGPIDGVVRSYIQTQQGKIYDFKSLDDTLQLQITQDGEGNWHRIGGSSPFLSAWIDELGELIHQKIISPSPDN